MNKILLIGASNSTTSINQTLANHAGSFIPASEKISLDLNAYEMPLYSPEHEEKEGIPEKAKDFVAQIEASNGVILSLAEHNGSYSAAFKNVLDWSSRHKQKLWSEKAMLLLSTSPGGRGGATVLQTALQTFPHLGAKISSSMSLPSFYDNFSEEEGIKEAQLRAKLHEAVKTFELALG